MAERIIRMRKLLKENLEGLGSRRDWGHITSQVRIHQSILLAFMLFFYFCFLERDLQADRSKYLDRHVRLHGTNARTNG